MASIDRSIEVEVPLQRAYNQWTRFEEFPQFMEGVKEVRQLDDTHLHWVVEVAGKTKEWQAEIIDQHPDNRVAWRSVDGTAEAGTVTFQPVGPERTLVMVSMEYEPEGAVEKIGDFLGVAGHRVQNDLERFKEFMETRHAGDDGWRGRVTGGRTDSEIPSGGVAGELP